MAQQNLESSKYYKIGHFFASRYYPYLNLKREENNLFFNALTINQLNRILPLLKAEQNNYRLVNKIIGRGLRNYADYAKLDGQTTVYQFWPIGLRNHFPNGLFLHRFKKFKSPPDVDDTALAYLTKPHNQKRNRTVKNLLDTLFKWRSKRKSKSSQNLP